MPEILELLTLPDGTVLRGYEIDFESVKETWSEYRLADGTKVRTKHTMLKVYRLVTETDEPLYNEIGEPQVFINGSMAVVASKG
ncbi:MAG: hypothetical protein IPK17_15695 [Chloroflexi bacterium]|uniref:hypothetical protein n=1 Tax=Candidatus Flexifilum breve TaxID=3140694 RepID=UPI00313759CC|nr:hypothetical protein [Chloroflexota bacterium]